MLKKEIFKIIKKYPRYSVSNMGNVYDNIAECYVTQYDNVYGYYIVHLKDVNGRTVTEKVHKLVYETFIGPIPENCVIDHINGISHDNRLDNIRAVTAKANCHNIHNDYKTNRVAQLDENGNTIHVFNSPTEASGRLFGSSKYRKAIIDVCKGYKQQYRGIKFIFVL